MISAIEAYVPLSSTLCSRVKFLHALNDTTYRLRFQRLRRRLISKHEIRISAKSASYNAVGRRRRLHCPPTTWICSISSSSSPHHHHHHHQLLWLNTCGCRLHTAPQVRVWLCVRLFTHRVHITVAPFRYIIGSFSTLTTASRQHPQHSGATDQPPITGLVWDVVQGC